MKFPVKPSIPEKYSKKILIFGMYIKNFCIVKKDGGTNLQLQNQLFFKKILQTGFFFIKTKKKMWSSSLFKKVVEEGILKFIHIGTEHS